MAATTKKITPASADQLREKVAGARAAMAEGILALVQGQGWRERLDTLAVLGSLSTGRLSFGNMVFVMAQAMSATSCPSCGRRGPAASDVCSDCGEKTIPLPLDGSRVATFEAWRRLGRPVKKGSRGLLILRPQIAKRDAAAGEEGGEEGEKKVAYFRAMTVFAYDQTEGEPLPEVKVLGVEESEEDFAEACAKLQEWAVSGGYVSGVELRARTEKDPDQSWAGWFNPKTKGVVVITGEKGSASVFKTLVHELAHAAAGHGSKESPEQDRGEQELVAESVAYCVAQAIGLDTSEYSFGYVASWASSRAAAKGDKEALDKLRRRIEAAGNRVAKLSHTILAGLCPELAPVDTAEEMAA